MAVIEYSSYLWLGANAIPKELQVDFLSYLEYFINEGNNTLRDNLKNTLSVKNFPSRSDDNIIEGILACSPKELEKKRNNENYYICNAICLLNVINRIFNNDLFHSLKNANTPTIALHNYEHILKWMLIDAEELQNLYRNNLKKDFQYASSFDTRYIHYVSVHQVLRQSLFGQVSCDSFADMEISASITIIRQLVELRIRRAFGVLSYVDESNGNLLPLDLSIVFECIKKYEKNIEFPLKLENIERIYKWANMYVHSGKTELSWIPYYIENKLRELSFGQQLNDGWNVNNGIVVSDKIIQDIHAELLKDKPKLKIFSCLPECARK